MAARIVSAASLACLVFQVLAVEISDCGVGTYFLENPQDQQTCQKVGDCLECSYDPLYSYQISIPIWFGTEQEVQLNFPSYNDFFPGMYCDSNRAMPWTYFNPELDELAHPADLTYQTMYWTRNIDLENYAGVPTEPGAQIKLAITQFSTFNCNSSHYCPNPWTACDCESGSFCLNGFSAPGRCTFGATCDGGPGKAIG